MYDVRMRKFVEIYLKVFGWGDKCEMSKINLSFLEYINHSLNHSS